MKKITLGLFGILLVTAGWAQKFDYSFSETYSLKQPSNLSISSSDGNIDLASWDKPEVQVYFIARRLGKVLPITKEELSKEVDLEIDQQVDGLRITVKNKPTNSIFNWTEGIDVSFRIFCPKEVSTSLHSSDGNIALTGPLTGGSEVKTSDGNIIVSDVDGDVEAGTSDGNVTVHRVAGRVQARSSDGHIQLESVHGDVMASTSDGNISLTDVSGEVSAKTSDGHISFDRLSGSIIASSSDGSIRGTMVKVTSALSLKTSDGNIDIQVPGGMGWDMDIHGESLHVPLENFSGQADKKRIQGKVDGGGLGLNLSTGDGDVRVSYN